MSSFSAPDAAKFVYIVALPQLGKPLNPGGNVSCFSPVPSALIVKSWICPTPPTALWKMICFPSGDHDALIHLNLAVRLQPYVLPFQTWRAVALFCTGQHAAGLRHLRDILEFEPDDYLANYCLGLVSARLAEYDEARQAAARAYDLSRSNQALGQLGYVEAQAGHVEAAEAILEQLTVTARTEYVARSWLGAIQLTLGRLDRAAVELRRAYAEVDWELGWALSDPRWDPLRGKIGGL
jgi:Flp pilus assembly protein TadD